MKKYVMMTLLWSAFILGGSFMLSTGVDTHVANKVTLDNVNGDGVSWSVMNTTLEARSHAGTFVGVLWLVGILTILFKSMPTIKS